MMKHKIKNYLFHAGLTEDEYKQIKKTIDTGNRQNLTTFSIIASIFLLIMFLLSFFSADVAENRWVYLISMLITLIILVVSRSCCEERPELLNFCIYFFMGVLFIFGIILGTVTRPDEQTVTFIALLLTVPLLFTGRPIHMICTIYLYVIIFVFTALKTKEAYVLAADIIDTFIFGSISAIVSSYMMNVKCQRYLFERRALLLSEIDLLTGLQNRNSYEKNMAGYPSLCRNSLSCIFIDVNGLHELNNTKGHEAGDRMLQFVARNLQIQFGDRNIYRIGGDEFVIFVIDRIPEYISEKMTLLLESIRQEGYHISVGTDTQTCPGINIASLIKNAEKNMYLDKKRFYNERGIEWNRR